MAEINYAGVAFAFSGPDTLLEHMERLPGAGPGGLAPAARISCRLHETEQPAPVLDTASERGWLHWEWRSATAHVSTRSARAQLWSADGAYAADAWLPPSTRAAATLVSALASAVLHDIGGFMLHAASILEAAGVVAFVGPSGAGKSTACGQMHGALIFSFDRLIVVPRPRPPDPSRSAVGKAPTWLAYPLFGGTPLRTEAPRATPDWSPLRAILRVYQSPDGALVKDCPASSALALLRESAFSGGSDRGAELELLARLERVRSDVPVGRLHFALGSCLTPVVSRWLSERSC